jgi:serine/threonine protein kinase
MNSSANWPDPAPSPAGATTPPPPTVPPSPGSRPGAATSGAAPSGGGSAGDSARNVFSPLAPDDPRTVAGYQIKAKLGAGGMGKVYLSYTPGGRPVAIKVIRPDFAQDPEFRRRFKQEVQAAQRVQGLFTAPVIDCDTEGANPWLATAYVPGPSLHAAVAEFGPLPVSTIVLLVAGIAEALQVIHSAGIVHRDLKPANVLLASDGPRVIDFGIARAADATSLTASGVTVGSPAFMAPEQASGTGCSSATDIFALGQVAAYAATGTPPFGEGTSTAVLYRIVHEEPDLSRVPEELRGLVGRCLSKDPEQRPATSEIIAMCAEAAAETSLRRPEDWVPSAVAADITRRTNAPVPPPLPSAVPGAVPGAGAAVPPPPVHTPAHTPPPVPPQPAVQPPAAQHPQAPYPQTQHPQAQQPAGPTPTMPAQQAPQQQPQQQPGPAGAFGTAPGPFTAYQPTVPQAAAQHHTPAPHLPDPAGTPPPGTVPVTPAGSGTPPRKSRRGLLVTAAVVLVLATAGVTAWAVTTFGKDDNKSHGQAHDSAAGKNTGGDAAGSPSPTPADESSASPSQDSDSGAAASPSVSLNPNPTVKSYKDIDITSDYGLDLDLVPPKVVAADSEDVDISWYDSDFSDDSLSASSSNKLVLLDPKQTGSYDVCSKDTRYTESIDKEQLPQGSQVCSIDQDGTVALIKVNKYSPDSSPSKYINVDVTVWR